jgi:hypothetical protein
MVDRKYSIEGYFDHAIFQGDINSLRASLEGNRNWAVKVLEYAGAKARIVEWVAICNKMHPNRIRAREGSTFLAIGTLGKRRYLAYKIEAHDEGTVRITPTPFLEPHDKIYIALKLAIIYIIPVLLSPFIWHKWEEHNLRFSRYYLNSFCHYLESQSADEGEQAGGAA